MSVCTELKCKNCLKSCRINSASKYGVIPLIKIKLPHKEDKQLTLTVPELCFAENYGTRPEVVRIV